MTDRPFHLFLKLINHDQAIRAIQAAITVLENSIVQYTKDQSVLDLEQQYAQQKVHDLRKKVDAQELLMKDLDSQEKDKRAKIDASSNQREYLALKNEVQQIRTEQSRGEELLMQVWNQLETAQKDYDAKHKAYQDSYTALAQSIAGCEDAIKKHEQELELMMHDRVEKERLVPGEWLEKYTLMKTRVSDPVVAVIQRACGACFYTITNQEMLRLNFGGLVQCKGCFRLLYVEEVMQEMASNPVGDTQQS